MEVFADAVDGASNGPRATLVATYGPLDAGGVPGPTIWTLPGLTYDPQWEYLYLQVFEAGAPGSSQEPEELAWLAPVWFETTP